MTLLELIYRDWRSLKPDKDENRNAKFEPAPSEDGDIRTPAEV
jgi:hypothetical protein